MIAEYLADLIEIDGIEAVVIFTKDNTIIDQWATPHFNTQVFNELCLNYQQIFAVGKNEDKSNLEVNISHEKGIIFVKQFSDFFLLVLAKSKVDTALIRIMANVGLSEVWNSRKGQKILKKYLGQERNYLDKEYLDDVEEEYLNKIMQREKNIQ